MPPTDTIDDAAQMCLAFPGVAYNKDYGVCYVEQCKAGESRFNDGVCRPFLAAEKACLPFTKKDIIPLDPKQSLNHIYKTPVSNEYECALECSSYSLDSYFTYDTEMRSCVCSMHAPQPIQSLLNDPTSSEKLGYWRCTALGLNTSDAANKNQCKKMESLADLASDDSPFVSGKSCNRVATQIDVLEEYVNMQGTLGCSLSRSEDTVFTDAANAQECFSKCGDTCHIAQWDMYNPDPHSRCAISQKGECNMHNTLTPMQVRIRQSKVIKPSPFHFNPKIVQVAEGKEFHCDATKPASESGCEEWEKKRYSTLSAAIDACIATVGTRGDTSCNHINKESDTEYYLRSHARRVNDVADRTKVDAKAITLLTLPPAPPPCKPPPPRVTADGNFATVVNNKCVAKSNSEQCSYIRSRCMKKAGSNRGKRSACTSLGSGMDGEQCRATCATDALAGAEKGECMSMCSSEESAHGEEYFSCGRSSAGSARPSKYIVMRQRNCFVGEVALHGTGSHTSRKEAEKQCDALKSCTGVVERKDAAGKTVYLTQDAAVRNECVHATTDVTKTKEVQHVWEMKETDKEEVHSYIKPVRGEMYCGRDTVWNESTSMCESQKVVPT